MTESLNDDSFLSLKKDNNGGRPLHEPTEELIKQVKAMVSCGVQGKLIASSIGISEPTLIKHYKDHMNVARASAHLQVGNSLFQRAINGDTSSAIFYAKTQMGWREPKSDMEELAKTLNSLTINRNIINDDTKK